MFYPPALVNIILYPVYTPHQYDTITKAIVLQRSVLNSHAVMANVCLMPKCVMILMTVMIAVMRRAAAAVSLL